MVPDATRFSPHDDTFELGLVMAGAISAGAYTAGVMDFLIEALDAYEAARHAPDWDGPTHAVRVPLMAGASAGGMTSAMCAIELFREMTHVRPATTPPPPEMNRLYSNWVRRIDLKGLLATGDLAGVGAKDGVRSVLDCTILEAIVGETFIAGPFKARAWLGRDEDTAFRVLLTLTNLRGVPYSFEVFGAESEPYAMLNHGDYLDFKIGHAPKAEPGTSALDVGDTNGAGWDMFRAAALATGAFPIGLAPRPISRPVTDYDVSLRVGIDTPAGFQSIAPDKIVADVRPYDFVAVDGGTIDNEPLEIARRLLAKGGHLDDNGETARRALVLIAPFPNFTKLPLDDGGLRIVDTLPRLSTTLVQQSRFKMDELQKAANETVFSRFLISPTRDYSLGAEAAAYPIASGVLNGFGGFIDESFRRHDFLLGRRNAQAFLRFHFALPETHPLFRAVKACDKWHVMNPDADSKRTFALAPDGARDVFGLPIIPLCGTAANEVVIGAADLPRPGGVDQAALGALIDDRAGAVVDALVDHDLAGLTEGVLGGLKRWAAKLYLKQIVAKKGKTLIAEAIAAVGRAFA